MLLEVIDDAAGRTDQHVDALFEDAALFFVIHAAEYDRQSQARVFGNALRVGVNLHRQFTGRRDDDGSRCGRRLVDGDGFGQQPVEEGDEECSRLAGAGLCLARDIAARECDRQGLRLNRSAAHIAEIGDTPLQRFGNV